MPVLYACESRNGSRSRRFGYVPRLGTSPRNSWQPIRSSSRFRVGNTARFRSNSTEIATTIFFCCPTGPILHAEQYADGSADRYFKNGVYYFGGGKEHILAENAPIKLTSGQTLYIDEGTTLYGRIEARGSNITITGRGTLSGAKLQHVGNQYASGNILIDVLNNNGSNNCSGFKINGITIVDTPSWCLRIFNTDDVTIDNINMIHWILNGDGIDICTGKRISITDCMLRTYDDCITLKVRHNAKPIGPIDDVKIERCQVWTELARGIVVGPECGDMTSLSYKTGGISNVSVSDCVVLEASRANDSNFENAGLGVMAESARIECSREFRAP